MKKKKPLFKRKFFFLTSLVIIAMLLLYSRLVFLAVSPTIDGIEINHFARQRNMANIELPARRGNIYDRNGLNLATAVSSYTVIAFIDESRTNNLNRPNHVVDKRMTARTLAPVLNMEEDYIYGLLNRRGYQVELGPGGRDISELLKREIESLNLPGIAFLEKPSRHYPNGDFASYIVGYVRRFDEEVVNNGIRRFNYNIVGELGIEGLYNEKLSGEPGKHIFQRDRFGHRIPNTPEQRIEAQDGYDVYLTIDNGIQRFLEASVKDVQKNYQPEWIQISVLEAKTGRLLGSATTPSFNPNRLNIVNYENPLTTFLFEPGSTMKTYTYMCAMEHGLYNEHVKVKSGRVQIHDRTVTDWRVEGFGMINFAEGFKHSSNVAAVKLVQSLSPQQLRDCFLRYGFGSKTDIQLPRELNGRLPFTNQVEKANAAFGQGLTTTAIQHLQGLTMIANDGYMLKPHVIDRIYDPNNKEYIYQAEIEKQAIVDQEIAEKMQELMHQVIYEEGGTGRLYRDNNYSILGKTGTAEIFDNQRGRYLTGDYNYVYSFAGMFPADDPEIIIYSAMKKPTYGRHLGMLYANNEIIENIGKYLGIGYKKEENNAFHAFEVENYINRNIDQVKKLKEEYTDFSVIIICDGKRVIDQRPHSGANLLPNDKLLILTEGEEVFVPDFRHWSRRRVQDFAELTKIDYNIDGWGYVKTQNIESGTILNREDTFEFLLESKIFE